jgi:hypothetical protein
MLITINPSKELDNKIKMYKLQNDISDKRIAIIKIIEEYFESKLIIGGTDYENTEQ